MDEVGLVKLTWAFGYGELKTGEATLHTCNFQRLFRLFVFPVAM